MESDFIKGAKNHGFSDAACALREQLGKLKKSIRKQNKANLYPNT
jgi:hypothetical protein